MESSAAVTPMIVSVDFDLSGIAELEQLQLRCLTRPEPAVQSVFVRAFTSVEPGETPVSTPL